MTCNVGMLGNWLTSWIQPSGAIYGFHNHSVWGGNPYRWADYTCGHSTFACPMMAGLSLALSQKMNPQGLTLLEKMIDYQTQSFKEDGQYKHIGFQVGELIQFGLIHNVVADISLAITADHGKEYLSNQQLEAIRRAILRNLEGCKMYGNGRAGMNACCNQDYARIWVKLLFQKVFEDMRFHNEIVEDLEFMINNFHIKGMPDKECEATYRALTNKDKNIVEPAEYYGFMIGPLVLAYELYQDRKYLKHAGSICKHVVRSAWKDKNNQIRVHRLWYKNTNENWEKLNTPMLVAGIGLTLLAIQKYLEYVEDMELEQFLRDYDHTYAYYQTNRGYFVSATGWQSEVDIAPSSAWHAHDFYYLLERQGVSDEFWNNCFMEYDKISVLLGEQCIWMEEGKKWTIGDYYTADIFKLLGRKDKKVFGRDMAWTKKDTVITDAYQWQTMPEFIKHEQGIKLKGPYFKELDIYNMTDIPYLCE